MLMFLNPGGLRSRRALDDNIVKEEYAVCTLANPIGVQIEINHEGNRIIKWAKNITGRYMCSPNGVNWAQYTDLPVDKHGDDNPAGGALVLFLAVLLTLAFTGSWPMIFSLGMTLDSVKNKLEVFARSMIDMMRRSTVTQTMNIFNAVYLVVPEETASQFGTKVESAAITAAQDMDRIFDEEKRKMDRELLEKGGDSVKERRMVLFSRVYMGVAAVLMFGVSVAISQVFCAYIGWPNMVKMSDSHICYPIDTSALPLGFTPVSNATEYANSSATKYLRETASYNNLNSAVVSISGNTAIITSECEAKWVNLDDNSRYVVEPASKIVCESVDAVEVGFGKSRYREKCGDSFLYSMQVKEGHLSGMSHTWIKSGKTDNACKRLLSKCDVVWEDELGYKLTSKDNWQFCRVVQQEPRMIKVDENGNQVGDPVPNTDFVKGLTVDPSMARQYGWYTDGINEVIVTADFNKGIGSSLLFEENAKMSESEMEQTMETSGYFTHDTSGWHVNTKITGLTTKTSTLQCMMQYTLNNVDKYKQVAQTCESVKAEVVDGSFLRFSSPSTTACNFAVGIGSSGEEQIVTVGGSRTVSLLNAQTWRCSSSQNGVGTNCVVDSSTPHISIMPEEVNSSMSVEIVGNSVQPDSQTPGDLGLDLGSVFSFASSLLTPLLITGGVGAAIFIAIFVARRLNLCSGNRSHSSYNKESSSSSSRRSESSSSSKSSGRRSRKQERKHKDKNK